MHPSDDGRVIFEFEPAALAANDAQSRCLQLREMVRRGSAIKADVKIDAGRLLARRIARLLQPDSDGKEILIGGQSIFPLRIKRRGRQGVAGSGRRLW
jgi:hypothetical protein